MNILELSGDEMDLSGFFSKAKKAYKSVKPLTKMASPAIKQLAQSNPYTSTAYTIGKSAKGNIKNLSAAYKSGGIKGLLKSSAAGGFIPSKVTDKKTIDVLASIGLKNFDDIALESIPNTRDTETAMTNNNFSFSGDLQQGANNNPDLVRSVQRMLRSSGYNIDIDGIYGAQTRAAVVKFQKDNGLAADGIVGKRTMTALGLKVSKSAAPAAAPVKSNTYAPSISAPQQTITEKVKSGASAFGIKLDGKMIMIIVGVIVGYFIMKNMSQKKGKR